MIQSIITSLTELKKPCETATDEKLINEIIIDLEDTLKNNGRGVGLAANQIGKQYKIAIIRSKFGSIDLINPELKEKIEPFPSLEGCLSLPGIKCTVTRYKYITFINNRKELKAEGVFAVIIQHEIAHLYGRTIMDDKRRTR